MTDWMPLLIAATPPTIVAGGALLLGFLNAKKLDKGLDKVTTIQVSVDGRFAEVQKELKDATALILAMTGTSEHAKGMLQGALEEKEGVEGSR